MNPLDIIMDWYHSARDSLRVTRRVLDKGIDDAITQRHVFYELSKAESKDRLEKSQRELDNVVVVTLVAVFERTLRDFVVSVLRGALTVADAMVSAIGEEAVQDAEFWHFSERLIRVFVTVDEADRANVKQLIDFRNWFAHGRFLAEAPPVNVVPRVAYQRLTAFLSGAGAI